MGFPRTIVVALAAALAALGTAGTAFGGLSDWSAPQKIDEIPGNSSELNTDQVDGCPIQSPDGLSLYMASNRGGGQGLLDIWVARRASTSDPWGAPENLGEPVNSAFDDFCPTPTRKGLFFVSREPLPGACGLGDIYFAPKLRGGGFAEPRHLACAPLGPNSPLDEQGPSFTHVDRTSLLFFSRSSGAVPGDLFVARRLPGGAWGSASPIDELNDAAANDIQPNVRKDGRELVFSSNRAGGAGAQDIWTSTRSSVNADWSPPVNVAAVNTGASESRPSFSWDALTLLFGRQPGGEGFSDIFVATRTRD